MCPEPIAPHLEHFIAPWCTALRTVRDDVEKEHAFLGLAALLRLNARVCPVTTLSLHQASYMLLRHLNNVGHTRGPIRLLLATLASSFFVMDSML